MGFGKLLTELATAVTDCVKVILPGAAEALVDFGDKLMFSGSGDAQQVTAVFGMAIVGGVITFGAWAIKRIAKKVT